MLPAAAEIVSPGEMAGIARNVMIERIITPGEEYYETARKDCRRRRRRHAGDRARHTASVRRQPLDGPPRLSMDHLRQGIGLRGYGQQDPAVEYKFEGFDMFENMVEAYRRTRCSMLYHLKIQSAPGSARRS